MKMKLTRIFCVVLMVFMIAGSFPALAAEPETMPVEPVLLTESADGEMTIMADEYTYYYRTVDGVKQYRIWNNTRGVWMIPWTNC